MPDWCTSIEETRKAIDYFISQYPKATKDVARLMFAIELDGSLIGMVGIGNKEEVDNEIEVAYFISDYYTCKGYITEAVSAVCDWAFKNLKMDYLIAIVEIDNLPSKCVVEKCYFKKIETRMILNSGESIEKPFYYYRIYNYMED